MSIVQPPSDALPRSPLTSLADELILHIIEYIDDLDSLRNTALTCFTLNRLAEPYIYASVLIKSAEEALRLVQSLNARRIRAQAIKTLGVRYGKGIEPEDAIAVLNDEIECFSNLRHWTIESPCVNDTHWRQENVDFQCYVTLHSHVNRESLFALGSGSVIFHHPTLRRLHISCFDILPDDNLKIPDGSTYVTALESLTFEECNIDPAALDSILSLPKALKSLTLGERLEHFRQPFAIALGREPSLFMHALRRQAHSLRYLKHTGQSNRRGRPIVDREDLRALTHLEELDFRIDSILHWYLGVSFRPSDPATAPPNLKVLRIHDMPDDLLDGCPRLFGRETTYWALSGNAAPPRHVELVLCQQRHSDKGILTELWHDPARRDRVYEFAHRLKEAGVARFTVMAVKSEGYIPPYMYGEVLPYSFLAYDSDKPTMFGLERDDDVEKRVVEHGLREI